jgi:hypothetical protein
MGSSGDALDIPLSSAYADELKRSFLLALIKK